VVFHPENNTIKETVVAKNKNLHTTIYTLSEFFEIFAIMLEDFRKQNTMSACVSDLTQKISSRNTMLTSFMDPVSGRVDEGWNKFTIAVETLGKSEDIQTKKAHLLERFAFKTYQDIMPHEFKKLSNERIFKTSEFDSNLAANNNKLPNMGLIPGHPMRDEFCQRITRILMEKHCHFGSNMDGSWNLDDILFKYNGQTAKIQDRDIIPKCDDIYMEIILKTLKSHESPIRLRAEEDLNIKFADLVEIRDKIEMILLNKRNDYYKSIRNELDDQREKNRSYSVEIMNYISLTMWLRLDMLETFENMHDKLKICELHDINAQKVVCDATTNFEEKYGTLDFYSNKARQNNTDINEVFHKY
jgi:hypothetical protein